MNFSDRILLAERRHNAAQGANQKGRCIGALLTGRDAVPCKRYEVVVTATICEMCIGDPEFKQSLYKRYLEHHEQTQGQPCTHRGPTTSRKKLGCCGNKKNVLLDVFQCKLVGGTRLEPDCWACEDYAPRQREWISDTVAT